MNKHSEISRFHKILRFLASFLVKSSSHNFYDQTCLLRIKTSKQNYHQCDPTLDDTPNKHFLGLLQYNLISHCLDQDNDTIYSFMSCHGS